MKSKLELVLIGILYSVENKKKILFGILINIARVDVLFFKVSSNSTERCCIERCQQSTIEISISDVSFRIADLQTWCDVVAYR